MKKTIIPTVLAVSVFLLCSCTGETRSMPVEENTAPVSVSETAETGTASGTADTDAPVSEKATERADETALNAYADENVPVNEYFSLMRRECGGYVIEYPHFDETVLDREDAQKANALFESIADLFSERSKDPDTDGFGSAECGRYGQVLSVMMRYKYPSGMDKIYFKSVNFNLETGKLMTTKEVIDSGFFTNENAEDSLYQYAAQKRKNDILTDILYECWAEGVFPEYGAVKELASDTGYFTDFVLDNFRADKDRFSDIDTDIPYPYVYLDDFGILYIDARIAESENGEVINTLAAVGRDSAQTAHFNRKNIYDPIFPVNILFPDGAVEAAYTYVKGGYTACYEIEGQEIIKDGSLPMASRFAYRIHAYTDDNGDISELGIYAISAADRLIWKLDEASENWELVSENQSIIDTDEAYNMNALGAVCLYPSEYAEHLAAPIADAAATSHEDYILVGALYDGTTVSVLQGSQNGSGAFEADGILFQTELDGGEWIRVYCPRITDEPPTMAIEFATGFDKGTFIYSRRDFDITAYAFSDEAVG